jgi:hypothetical protein
MRGGVGMISGGSHPLDEREIAELLTTIKRLEWRLSEAKNVAEGWEQVGETISHFIPEHYESSEGAFLGIVEEWVKDANAVVMAAHAWRKCGRTQDDAAKLDAAVGKIYPSEDYL